MHLWIWLIFYGSMDVLTQIHKKHINTKLTQTSKICYKNIIKNKNYKYDLRICVNFQITSIFFKKKTIYKY